jgi:hypothetical protein
MHARDALKKGEDPDRIAVLPAWEVTDYFSEIRFPHPEGGKSPARLGVVGVVEAL